VAGRGLPPAEDFLEATEVGSQTSSNVGNASINQLLNVVLTVEPRELPSRRSISV
jgi:hypothetical protein